MPDELDRSREGGKDLSGGPLIQAVVTTVRQAGIIVRSEGLTGLGRATWDVLRRNLLRVRTADIFEYSLDHLDEIRVAEPTSDLQVTVVAGAHRQGDAARQAIVDLDRWAARKLARGAEAVCLLTGTKLVHVIWVARTSAACHAIDPFRYEVDFAHGQASSGGMFTVPDARGSGFGRSGLLAAFRHLAGQGVTSVRHAIEVANEPSLRLHAHFSPRRVGRARLAHVLGCTIRWQVSSPPPT